MVKERRRRAPTKGSIRTRSAVLAEDGITSDSPRRKETRLEFQGKLAHSPSATQGHIQKTSPCITSYFYPDTVWPAENHNSKGKENGSVSPVRSSSRRNITMTGRELFKTDMGSPNDSVQQEEDIIAEFPPPRTSTGESDVEATELFETDETPVAVPISGPPTPHRINMPEIPTADQKRNYEQARAVVNNGITTSPSSALSQMQIALKKPTGKGRGKLKQTQTLNAVNSATNTKLTDYFPVRRSVRKCKKTVLEEKQRDLENKVLCQVENGLKVRHFVGKGRGVVTTRAFEKGEFVVEYAGELIDQTMAKKREAEYAQDQNTGCYMYYFQHRNHQYCVDATPESRKLGRLVNHCRNGNLVARVVEVGNIPHLVLTAKEDIPAGVEVTYDYGDRSRESIRNHPWLAL